VQLASVDGRAHVAREPEGTYVAVGDFPFGAGVLLAQPDAPPHNTAAAAEELRRLVASLRLAQLHEPAEQVGQLVAKQLAAIASGAKTLDGIAKAGVELAQQFSQRGAAIVLHGAGPAGGTARVVAVSTAGDGRLAGLVLPSDAPVMRGPGSLQGAERQPRARRRRLRAATRSGHSAGGDPRQGSGGAHRW